VRSIAISVSVSLFVSLLVFLSDRTSKKAHVLISPNFLYMLPVAVARSSSDGNAIGYVLPVLWMTSCFHVIEQKARITDDACFVEFTRWRHRSEVCHFRLHLVSYDTIRYDTVD